MAAGEEACAIYIGNIDCNAVSEEDIVDWLKLLGEIRSISRRYNVATKETGYRVVFRNATTANLAVQFVDGVFFRDKERPLSITSTVFQKAAKAANQSDVAVVGEGEVPPPAGVIGTDPRVAKSRTILPCNADMPQELQMDFQLVCAIPPLVEAGEGKSTDDDGSSLFSLEGSIDGAKELFEKLKLLQQQYLARLKEEQDLAAKVESRREAVNALLRKSSSTSQASTRSPPPSASGWTHGGSGGNVIESVEVAMSKIPLRITASAPGPTGSATSSIAVFQALHDCFGPVSRAECYATPDGGMSIVAEFSRPMQATKAISLLEKKQPQPQKRQRDEDDPSGFEDKLHWLLSIGNWAVGAVRLASRESLGRGTLSNFVEVATQRQAQLLADSWAIKDEK